ncbi:hypothetical protein GCM10025858_27380 [Alicyclobacillus sacchari]|uniref:AbrB/MazE/SpoVT family DNA-binding domain-containing protein n=1 Tax=Alicyclobacillus sacchari TaxID=392010 RepID=UPI0010658BA0|nr:AbrB/MazE/SpoVT family DNA-binding domain-containing protein [Alicyclobacillus sacchari]GMA58235.1 hypothetical protein GCM10025858_27380 [Alicyclobacillus sacchari]
MPKKQYVLTMDDRGYIALPKELCDQLHIQPGDTLCARIDRDGFQVHKVRNPFDALAKDAIQQHQEGKTVSHEQLLKELGLD